MNLWGNSAKIDKYAFYITDRGYLVGVDIENARVVFKHKLSKNGYYPFNYNNKILLVPTIDSRIYGISVDPSCSILKPADDEEIGLNTQIKGVIFATKGPKGYQIKVNSNDYPTIGTNANNEFEMDLDLSKEQLGAAQIQCLAVDNAGEFEMDFLGYKVKPIIGLKEKQQIYAYIQPSLSLNPDQEFTLRVQNEYSADLENFYIEYLNQKTTANSPIKLRAPLNPGVYKIKIIKSGYLDREINFEVVDNFFLIKFLLVLVIVLGILVGAFWFLKKSKK
jgi:hypothetical protein